MNNEQTQDILEVERTINALLKASSTCKDMAATVQGLQEIYKLKETLGKEIHSKWYLSYRKSAASKEDYEERARRAIHKFLGTAAIHALCATDDGAKEVIKNVIDLAQRLCEQPSDLDRLKGIIWSGRAQPAQSEMEAKQEELGI